MFLVYHGDTHAQHLPTHAFCLPLPPPPPTQGPDVGDILELLSKDEGDLVAGEAYVPLDARMQRLEKAMSTLPAAKEA